MSFANLLHSSARVNVRSGHLFQTSKRRLFHLTSPVNHDHSKDTFRAGSPPQMPRRTGPIQKRPIPHVKKVLAVASGKGGVGKSTVAVNLAFALAMKRDGMQHPPRVGILDLDIFGPSIPKLMGLEDAEPQLTPGGAIIPITNHGLPCMSMGFLLPRSADNNTNTDTPVVWRGLMVQKATQQLLFDVDWSERDGGSGLDILVVDMPPGTGDVPLTFGQLVHVDGAVIVSTPQNVALVDVRKGINTFKKLSIPITGLVLNTSYFLCPTCTTPHHIFGTPDSFRATASHFGAHILGELPMVAGVSESSDKGVPYMLERDGNEVWKSAMREVADDVWKTLGLA